MTKNKKCNCKQKVNRKSELFNQYEKSNGNSSFITYMMK